MECFRQAHLSSEDELDFPRAASARGAGVRAAINTELEIIGYSEVCVEREDGGADRVDGHVTRGCRRRDSPGAGEEDVEGGL